MCPFCSCILSEAHSFVYVIVMTSTMKDYNSTSDTIFENSAKITGAAGQVQFEVLNDVCGKPLTTNGKPQIGF